MLYKQNLNFASKAECCCSVVKSPFQQESSLSPINFERLMQLSMSTHDFTGDDQSPDLHTLHGPGVRLRAKNRTTCTAVVMMYRLLGKEIGSAICNYTLATACLVLAAKYEEDRDIGVRDVINASHRILHPEGDPAKLDDHMYEVRKGVSELTFVVLRELNFDLYSGQPFDVMAAYMDTLRSWMPKEFAEHSIAASCNAMLRDCYLVPEFVLSHSPHALVLAVLSLVLKGYDLDVSHSHDWFQVLHDTMTEPRLCKVECEIIRYVYGLELDED